MAAQAPSAPVLPTVSFFNGNVTVSWAAPDNGGSVITGYTIQFRRSDNINFATTVSCNGTQASVIQAQSCTFAASVLNASPFSLPWGSPVIALMSAQNVYGTSASQYASGTAIIVTIPDAPLSLANSPTVTNAQRVGITWTAGAANGGTPVIDYSILWDQGTGNWVTRIAGLTTTSYTISQLSMGSTY